MNEQNLAVEKALKHDERWMRKAIELAKLGTGYVNPNPMVGAVIVKEGVSIGEGFHQKYGEAHAEINAINKATVPFSGATLYVTLEPCFHYGKTPPCVDAILREGFSRVVIGMLDPNPKVSGKSVEKLERAGIEVMVGILEDECHSLNSAFIKWIKTKQPYVLMKSAMTLDGKIATTSGESKWISGIDSRQRGHDFRHEYQGIMVGINTVLKDDPMLTARRDVESAQPVRIIVDSSGRIPLASKIVQTANQYPTILMTTHKISSIKSDALKAKGVQVEMVIAENNHVDLRHMMVRLGTLDISSVLLEGGGTLNAGMLKNSLVDEVAFFIAPKIFGGLMSSSPVTGLGIQNIGDAIKLKALKVEYMNQDLCVRGKVVSSCLQD